MGDTTTPKESPPKDTSLVRLLRTNPPAGAAMLLGLLVLPPLSILIMALPDGWSTWCTASVVLMAAAVLPAGATLLRFSWANAAGQYLCWAELIQVALRIVTTGFKPAHVVPAAAAVVALLTLTSAQPSLAAAKERGPDSIQQWVRENIEAIIVAFIMALVIRCFCIEVLKIPSSSMAPTPLRDTT